MMFKILVFLLALAIVVISILLTSYKIKYTLLFQRINFILVKTKTFEHVL